MLRAILASPLNVLLVAAPISWYLRFAADGSSAGLTLHTFDGTIPQLRRSLDRSLDAFFDLLPGAEDEDVEKFGD